MPDALPVMPAGTALGPFDRIEHAGTMYEAAAVPDIFAGSLHVRPHAVAGAPPARQAAQEPRDAKRRPGSGI